jgi:hypothetical protein
MRARFLDLSILLSLINLFSLILAFWEFDFLACARSVRFFSALALCSSISRVFYTFLASFSAAFAAFSRAAYSRAAIRSISFLTFFSAASRAFSSRAMACCIFLSAAVRFYWISTSSNAAARSRAWATFAELKNKI